MWLAWVCFVSLGTLPLCSVLHPRGVPYSPVSSWVSPMGKPSGHWKEGGGGRGCGTWWPESLAAGHRGWLHPSEEDHSSYQEALCSQLSLSQDPDPSPLSPLPGLGYCTLHVACGFPTRCYVCTNILFINSLQVTQLECDRLTHNPHWHSGCVTRGCVRNTVMDEWGVSTTPLGKEILKIVPPHHLPSFFPSFLLSIPSLPFLGIFLQTK